jgi:hypothetical protein
MVLRISLCGVLALLEQWKLLLMIEELTYRQV